MSTNARTIILDDFRSSLSDLLECYAGEKLELIEAELPDFAPSYSASIGFGTEKFRGSAVLLTDAQHASDLWGAEANPLNDWLGELGNQLVGRFKNKIVEFGILVNMGLPTTIHGIDINVEGEGYQKWYVKSGGCNFAAILKLAVDEDLELQRDPNLSSAEEGSLCLF